MRFLLLFLVFFLFNLNHNVNAQTGGFYCPNAQSTADTQKCLKKYLDNSQKRLNSVYKKLTGLVDDDSLDNLKQLQNDWILYRDKECGWEVSLSENPSLKRINELFCLSNMTESRANLLAAILQDKAENEGQGKFGNFPRWMNVVAKKEPKATWNYKDRARFDLNCDGDDEFIMSGVSFETTSDPSLYTAVYHISISENPAIGKPSAKIFDFPVSAEKDSGIDGLCSLFPDFNLIDNKNGSGDVCASKLELQNKGCDNYFIYWSGKEYKLENPEKKIKNKENKKETDKK